MHRALACLIWLASGCYPTNGSKPTPSESHSPPAKQSTEDTVRGQPLAPKRIPSASVAANARELRTRVPQGFTVVEQPPFVVAGDAPPDQVEAVARATVRWAVQRLQQDFFADDPNRVLTIWLFKDAASYEHHNLRLFGTQPTTPFGYYSSAQNALVMNISTGGGTLVHELVHPLMESNFADCPAWFNEGLGSLYEQSAERDGHIVGLTNWRLSGLQDAIRQGPIPSFRQLTSTTSAQFYDEDPGTNYAQARYLLYYLQERGLLVRYFHEFRRRAAEDPSGYQTLMRLLDEQDMTAFQRRWEQFVLSLSFP